MIKSPSQSITTRTRRSTLSNIPLTHHAFFTYLCPTISTATCMSFPQWAYETGTQWVWPDGPLGSALQWPQATCVGPSQWAHLASCMGHSNRGKGVLTWPNFPFGTVLVHHFGIFDSQKSVLGALLPMSMASCHLDSNFQNWGSQRHSTFLFPSAPFWSNLPPATKGVLPQQLPSHQQCVVQYRATKLLDNVTGTAPGPIDIGFLNACIYLCPLGTVSLWIHG